MITSATAQLRTTNLVASIQFYTDALGLTLAFQLRDFYAGIRAGSQMFHLKLVDAPDPTIDFVHAGRRSGPHHLHRAGRAIAGRARSAASTSAQYRTAWKPLLHQSRRRT